MLKMPKLIVINTGPLIALIAGLGDLDILKRTYEGVIVPYEVSQEILIHEKEYFGVKEFKKSNWLIKKDKPVKINNFLNNTLDSGEAAVIQTALNEGIKTVCIDEVAGRRVARLNNLKLTGSIGIVISAIKNGEQLEIKNVIEKMRTNGVWISDNLEKEAIKLIKNT